MFKPYDWLLFDLDNTLLDFSGVSKKAFADLVEHFEIDHTDPYDAYHPINAKYWTYFEKQKIDAEALRYGRFEEFLKHIDSKVDHKLMADKYLDLLIHHSEWIEGAEDVIKQLAQTHNLAIITNGLKDAQHGRLEKHGMKKYFKHIFISEEMGISKPHSAFFEQVHETINRPSKDKVLVIGDNPQSDIKGGRKFDYHTCWYDYRKDKKQSVNSNLKISSWLS
ncbi:MAG: YjjG family noncanonical pyrimidine nucleotidase [Chitinophagales bacterium]|jgi:YjjG family noncanonical pyrimidine nucleotidase